MDPDTLKLLGAGGVTTILLGGFLWLIRTVGVAIVAALKENTAAIHDHTTKDLEHHAEVKEAIVRVETKVDATLDRRWDELTPPVQQPPQRAVGSTTISREGLARDLTTYHQGRKRTEGEK